MIVGKMIELFGGKVGLYNGKFYYGSVFGEFSGYVDKVLIIRYLFYMF